MTQSKEDHGAEEGLMPTLPNLDLQRKTVIRQKQDLFQLRPENLPGSLVISSKSINLLLGIQIQVNVGL